MQPDIGGLQYLFSDIVHDNVRWVPDKPALIFRDMVTTWSEVGAKMKRVQRALASLGVTRGSRVALLERNSDEYIILGFALAGMGAVMCPINTMLRSNEINYILEVASPSLMLTEPALLSLAQDAIEGLTVPPKLMLRGGAVPEGLIDWDKVVDGAPDDIEVSRPRDWDDPYMILFTSGTTGRPKGAVISHRRTILDTSNAISAFDVKRCERFYCYMPLFHTGAWDYIKMYFMQRGSAVIAEKFDAVHAVTQLEKHRCTSMFGVPVVLRRMLETAEWASSDMSSMRLIPYSNFDPSYIIVDVLAAFRARGAANMRIANAYGMTEGGCYIAVNRPEDCEALPRSIGVPLPGVQVALMDEDMNEVPQGEVGEICARSPSQMSGYLNQPEATAETFRGGWLHTGDLARADENGFLYLVDRKKDMIRTGGENVFSKEVELAISGHPAVSEVAVFGMPDDDYGERIIAAVIRKPGLEVSEAELTDHVRAQIASFKAPKEVHFFDVFPTTPAGKVQKHIIKKGLTRG